MGSQVPGSRRGATCPEISGNIPSVPGPPGPPIPSLPDGHLRCGSHLRWSRRSREARTIAWSRRSLFARTIAWSRRSLFARTIAWSRRSLFARTGLVAFAAGGSRKWGVSSPRPSGTRGLHWDAFHGFHPWLFSHRPSGTGTCHLRSGRRSREARTGLVAFPPMRKSRMDGAQGSFLIPTPSTKTSAWLGGATEFIAWRNVRGAILVRRFSPAGCRGWGVRVVRFP